MNQESFSLSDFIIRPASPDRDLELREVEGWVGLINLVYEQSEQGIWKKGYQRIDSREFEDMVRQGELLMAFHGQERVGCVMVKKLSPTVGELGMLVCDPARQGEGIGRKLQEAAEGHIGKWGCGTIQLELLCPVGWVHPFKDRLHKWYTRIGYRQVKVDRLEKYYPRLVEHLATECDYMIYEKEVG